MKEFRKLVCIGLGLSVLWSADVSAQPCEEYRTASIAGDGTSIVFPTCDGKLGEFVTADSSCRVLDIAVTSVLDPSFSSNGTEIFFTDRVAKAEWAVFSYSRVTGLKEQLTRGFYDRYPRSSKSGEEVYFVRAKIDQIGESWGVAKYMSSTNITTDVVDRKFYRIDGLAVDDNGKVFFTARKSRRSKMSLYRVVDRKPMVVEFEKFDMNSVTVASNLAFGSGCNRLLFASDRDKRFHYDIFLCQLPGFSCKSLGLTSELRLCMSPMTPADCSVVYFLAASDFDQFNRPMLGLWKCKPDGSGVSELLKPKEFAFPGELEEKHEDSPGSAGEIKRVRPECRGFKP